MNEHKNSSDPSSSFNSENEIDLEEDEVVNDGKYINKNNIN